MCACILCARVYVLCESCVQFLCLCACACVVLILLCVLSVLGLDTASTHTGVYDELVRIHKEEGLSFRDVITFNVDEYYPIEPTQIQSHVR